MKKNEFLKLLRDRKLDFEFVTPSSNSEVTILTLDNSHFRLYRDVGPEFFVIKGRGQVSRLISRIELRTVEKMSEQEAKNWVNRF